MRTSQFLVAVCSVMFFLYGCNSTPEKEKDLAIKFTPEMSPVTLATAVKLEESGKYIEALKQYSQLTECAADRKEYHKAICGKSRCLTKMGKYNLAISVLAPLPVDPRNNRQCEKLAMAGELLMRMNKYPEAESALEVAISGADTDNRACLYWLAPASANLGKSYLQNGKLQQAEAMYEKAEKLFGRIKNSRAQKKCRKILMELEKI